MRITSGSYYNNIYGENNKINQQMFDVNKQIASGQKIQYAHEDPGVFIDTLRLDNEITTLSQVKTSSQSAYKISTQTDTTIGEIVKTIESMKVKLINAANDVNSDASTQAIAKELRGLKNHLLTLANTSIGGQYLFSGTAASVKPIGADGTYQGNDQNLEAFLGSGVKQKYNISGDQLFLGEENKINRTITTNVPQFNLTDLYGTDKKETYITASSTIGDLMGNMAKDPAAPSTAASHFYIQGTRHNGETFKAHIPMNSDETVDDLMQKIALQYDPNLTNLDLVNVSINAHGQIEIADKQAGSSKLDFHMVGAVDFDGDTSVGADAAEVTNIDALQPTAPSSNNFEDIISGSKTLYIKEFTKSGFTTPAGTPNTIEGINYDRTNFKKDGATLFSNVSQIVKSDNSFAQPSTKLLDVAGVVVPTLPLLPTLVGQTLKIQGKNTLDQSIDLQINLANPSTITGNVNGAPIVGFKIYDASGAATNADNVTYQQLNDIVNMALTNSLPLADNATAYNDAIKAANTKGSITLDYAGRIVFKETDPTKTTTSATLSMYDESSSNYTVTDGSALTFNANGALTIRDPKTDFFSQIEQIIKSVEEGKTRADGNTSTDPRNIGIQNSIQMLDDLSDHVSRLQTEAGSYSQVLQASSDRTDMLLISTKTLQSDVIDTDVAEATLRMQQLSLNYQAMLSSISKVSQLSLVNYL